MTKGQRARELFLSGYNCAQSVVCAFAEEMGLAQDVAARLASGLGGGVGRLRETCGAVTGMALVYGMLRGYSEPGTHAGKTATYAAVQRMGGRFRAQAGSLCCRELLGLPGEDCSPKAEPRTPAYYQSRPCPDLVACAADILANELAGAPWGEGPVQPGETQPRPGGAGA